MLIFHDFSYPDGNSLRLRAFGTLKGMQIFCQRKWDKYASSGMLSNKHSELKQHKFDLEKPNKVDSANRDGGSTKNKETS